MSPATVGVHLVGSICGAPTTIEAITKISENLPNHVSRIPDGEPAHRASFIGWQMGVFKQCPAALRKYDSTFNSIPQPSLSSEEIESIVAQLSSPPLHTGYDDAAIESYGDFRKLRDQGILPQGVKFLVALPTVMVVTCLIREGLQPEVEKLYEAAMLRDIAHIEASIPHEDLAIQFDVAGEFMTLEESYWPHFAPWWNPVKEGVVERLVRLGSIVSRDVELGYHFCYGDMKNQHFVEPKDMGLMIEVAGMVFEEVKKKREVNWLHMPVPKNRNDEAYFEPLKAFNLGKTELYLGLVHAGDEEGTKKRVEVAARFVQSDKFGVATECGLGRSPPENLGSIMEICKAVAAPIK
ncbi:hypothetical protein GGU10DRAFT_136175 [Lentinula aff. detonsa]|uniref:Methionine synthase n=1 Tax=Lentinula aff. detonsa TaxID=2804958 RepID=A0AA38L2X9_9AGAR|nr:hypothetical protein GGU10DRAFT_136175 [Lentinula aff. detonsa]